MYSTIKHAESAMGLAEMFIKDKFDGCILDWQPIYTNEKEWYKLQCTRNVLIEKWKK
jgi:hypothetical protein